jgi:hypothetical protein
MVDRHGNLLALVAMKTLAIDASISSYGLGISTDRLRQFVEKQKSHFPNLNFDPGATEGPGLSTEELADKLAPATVCILMMRGEDPGSEEVDSAGGSEGGGAEEKEGEKDKGEQAPTPAPAGKGAGVEGGPAPG